MARLRWKLEGEDDLGQGALFPGVERHVGRGEFRGIEFLHVNAGKVINTLAKSGPLPFRHTINAYRGCSHACSYCAAPETPVLMGDGRTKAIADLRVGDSVYGTERVGAYRRYVLTTVLDHWSTVKPALRVRLEDGTQLVTSGDHRFLTNRGWKYVTGAGRGPSCRPHLTTTDHLLGTGQLAEGPKHDADYRAGYLCGMVRGDAHLSPLAFRLALVDREPLHRTAHYLLEMGVLTKERMFQQATATRKAFSAIYAEKKHLDAIEEAIQWRSGPSDEWRKGFLAGIFDAESTHGRWLIRITNGDQEMIDQIVECLERFGFRFVIEHRRARQMMDVRITGGLVEHLRFFLTVDPATTRKRGIEGQALKNNALLRVVAVEPLGLEMSLYDITTGTGDFIANGVVSHNCFARPTHDYLGLDIGEGFERSIVVKVNAVERVRAELDPRRWCGEAIAMGTNTDPYQRCEGKYRLTRGIVGALSEARNPFSILTKSTLVLSDLDLLAEASGRTEVFVNLSIGTLDEDVWKATEPGTPHPAKRMEAVARLNDAGVRCGVLVAPVLPGLSDRPEQLAAVAKAAVEAKAAAISGGQLVYLKPGVKEVFLARLAQTHPELVATYEGMFRTGAYAPKNAQEAMRAALDEAIGEHRGTKVAFFRNRAPSPEKPPPPPTPITTTEQLGLSL